MTNSQVIKNLIETNDPIYQIQKAAEEFQELALVLMQKSLKPKKVDDQEIIDEIGDCQIRMEILLNIYSPEKIQERVNYKLQKFGEFIEQGKYKGGI